MIAEVLVVSHSKSRYCKSHTDHPAEAAVAESVMTLLPHCAHAIIEDSKLVRYALNPRSERGQHKARVFAQVLGFNLSNWELLKRAIIEA